MPLLIINPATDEEFVALVRDLARDASSPTDLEQRLREPYPRAVARSRDLEGEGRAVWYVYRDGHWVSSGMVNDG